MFSVVRQNQQSQAQRYFTPSQNVVEQVSILKSLMTTARTNEPARVYLVTPALAEWILLNINGTIRNRPRSAKFVQDYRQSMEEGEWEVTGATIVFGKSGRLLDGQHRLEACAKSGKAFHSYLVFGIDDIAFANIDRGRRRNGSDVFTIADIANPTVASDATRWIYILAGNPTKPDRGLSLTNPERLAYYHNEIDAVRFGKAIDTATEVCRVNKKRGSHWKLNAGMMTALFYFMLDVSEQDTKAYAKQFIGDTAQAKAVMARIRSIRDHSGGRIHEATLMAALILGWRIMRGKASKTLLNKWSSEMLFPTIA